MDTESIRAKFEVWWQSTGKKDLVSYTSGISSNRLTINYKEMAFEAYQQAVKDMELFKVDAIEAALRESLSECANKENYRWDYLSELIGNYANKLRGGS